MYTHILKKLSKQANKTFDLRETLGIEPTKDTNTKLKEALLLARLDVNDERLLMACAKLLVVNNLAAMKEALNIIATTRPELDIDRVLRYAYIHTNFYYVTFKLHADNDILSLQTYDNDDYVISRIFNSRKKLNKGKKIRKEIIKELKELPCQE